MFRHRPHATDPDKMYFDRMIFNRVPKGQTKADPNAGAVDLFVELGNEVLEGRPEHVFYRRREIIWLAFRSRRVVSPECAGGSSFERYERALDIQP